MSKSKQFGSAARGIATKAELEQRIAARPKPQSELHLTMDGYEASHIHRQVDQASERRINHLRERLNRASTSVKRDHLRARFKGKPKSDFDRSR